MTTPQPAALPDLTAVIAWLENGCDPSEAVKELKHYQSKLRALAALQSQPAAEVSDAEIERIFKECGGQWNGDQWVIEDADFHPAIREFFALRPQAVPMTDEQIVAALKACDREDPSKEGWIWRTRIKWARAIEAHHRITAPAGGEG